MSVGSNINKSQLLTQFLNSVNNSIINTTVITSANLPPVVNSRNTSNGTQNFNTYAANIYRNSRDSYSAGSVSGSKVSVSALLAAIRIWSTNCRQTRRVRTGLEYSRYGTYAADSGYLNDRTDRSNVTSGYPAFGNELALPSIGGVVSWTYYSGNFLPTVNTRFNTAINNNIHENRVCHSSCHNNCHGSRGRR